jgi:cysteine-rich repeat protein
LPLDTLNDWTACGVDDQQTCWDANNFVYMCPAIASVYEYSYDTVANTYQVHIPFEYFTDEAALEQEFDEFILNPDAFTTDRSCVGQTLSPFGGVCGDGTVNPGEECDPPGSSGFISGICQANEIAPAVCGTSCTWEFGACQPAFQCGNGVVEAGENCDDGSFNGSYGHCANDCQGPSAQFCGNSIKDDPNEFCDWSASPWADQSGVSPYYATNQTDSCAADCLSTGSYCGDGILQASEGEACDDGNTASGDGCSPSCKEENLACFNQNPQYYKGQIVGTEQLHYFFLTRVDPADFSDFVAFHDANPGDLGPFYPGTSHINQCLVGSNCNEICGTAGLFCEGMYEVKKSVNFPGQSTWSPLVKSLDLSQKFENSPADRVYVAACSGQYTPPAAPSSVPLGELACGNGIVENETTHPDADPSQWEACDLGDQNGIACTPGYGEGCSYCSANCQNVITIDPVEYCGNGQIDVVKSIITPPPIVGVFYELEACDIDTSGNVYQGSDSVVQNIFPFLTDLNNAGSISCPDKGTYQCTNSCTELDDSGCVTCGVTFDNTKPAPKLGLINPMIRYANPDNPDNWPIDFVAGLFRSKETGGNISYDYFGFFGHAEEPGTTPPIPEEKNPFLDTEGSLNEKMGIESDLQCNGEYTTIFFPSLPALVGFVFNPDIGLKLPYPVDGETAEVYNEYVYNPVVPEGVYRAVVRWSATDGTSNNFVGGVYTEENTSDPNISYADAGPDSDGTTAYCSSIVQNAEKYWMPAAGPSDICTKYADAVYVHPQNGLENTFIQSFTIDTATADSDFGFYVQAIGFDRIANYKFTDLVVELYEYHDGQDPENFIFEPVYTFRIQDSAGTSSNPTAKYWHVFNLEKNLVTNEYEVVPVKSIETDECQLKAGIPDAYLGNCEPE